MKVTKNFQKHDNKIEPKASKKNQRIPKKNHPPPKKNRKK